MTNRRKKYYVPKHLAGGGLLTESIDNDEFHELVSNFKNYSGVRWSDIIDYIVEHMYREVDAQVEFYAKNHPQRRTKTMTVNSKKGSEE